MEKSREEALTRATRLRLGMEAAESLRQVREFADKPAGMDYFYNLLEQMFTGRILPVAKTRYIGTMCAQIPDELIYGVGAQPLRLCSGSYSYDQLGADHLPPKSCPLLRATTGMFDQLDDSIRNQLLGVVVPTTCDQKKKMAERLRMDGYRVCILEMPASKESEIARYYWQESVKHFALELEQMSGRRLRRSNVRQAIAKKTRACRLYRALMEMHYSAPPVISGTDILLVANCYFLSDIDSWTAAAEALVREMAERVEARRTVCSRNAPRILLTGSPPVFPNIKVPLLVEQSGAIIVADEVCSSSRLLYDAVSYDEPSLNDMIPAIADRYLKPCTCPCLTPNTDRTRKIAELLGRAGVDGVVYQAFSGCLPYEMEQSRIAAMLEEAGIPMLYLETDYSPEDKGQLSTRIEAFLEAIRMRRRVPRKKTAVSGGVS